MLNILKNFFKKEIKPQEKIVKSKVEDNTKSIYPEDSLSSIEMDYCKKLQEDSSCINNEKFSIKNYMLKSSS
jgi:hypothetical protein